MQKKTAIIIVLGLWITLYPHKSMASYLTAFKSPYPKQAVLLNNLKESDKACPATPIAVRDMDYVSIYTNKSHGSSIIDPKAQKLYTAQTLAIKNYEIQIYKWIESALSKRKTTQYPIKCSIKWMADWAQDNALLGNSISPQGQAVRKWTLATLSSQYIQIKDAKWINKNQKQEIEFWLDKLATQVMLDCQPNPNMKSRNNNHQYWAAWSVMITGITLNNSKYYKWGISNYKKAVKQMNSNGSLPLELHRETKAFHYHLFSASPLIMMAETAKTNGYNLYKYKKSRLLKFINFILNDLDNGQKETTTITGEKQNLDRSITTRQLSWLNVYNKNYPDVRAQKWIKGLKPMVQRRIGGNLSRIFPLD